MPPPLCQERQVSRRGSQRFCRKARIRDDVRSAVSSGGNAPPIAASTSSNQAALPALLKGRGEYDAPVEPVTLAPFCLERVSLPETESLSGVPPAGANPEHARRFLDRPELMLKEDPPIESFTPYWDPCLLHSKRHYIAFIPKLMSIGFLLFTTTPKEHIGAFFVHRSDGQPYTVYC